MQLHEEFGKETLAHNDLLFNCIASQSHTVTPSSTSRFLTTSVPLDFQSKTMPRRLSRLQEFEQIEDRLRHLVIIMCTSIVHVCPLSLLF
jgi:hypothetical protein